MPPFLKIARYINKVKNPYYYKVGDVKVRTSYADTDRTLDDAFMDLIKLYDTKK